MSGTDVTSAVDQQDPPHWPAAGALGRSDNGSYPVRADGRSGSRHPMTRLPVMQTLNEVLGASSAAKPPMRDIGGALTRVRVQRDISHPRADQTAMS